MFASVRKFKKQSGRDTFGRRVTFLVGANDSDKSNALVAMRLFAMRDKGPCVAESTLERGAGI